MKSYPEQDNSYQHAVTEHLNTALTNIVYYYNYLKENYVDPTVEHISELSLPKLTLWQWTAKLPVIEDKSDSEQDDRDYIDWASLEDVPDRNYETLINSVEMDVNKPHSR